jgi:hypothetical protein
MGKSRELKQIISFSIPLPPEVPDIVIFLAFQLMMAVR